MVKLDREDGIYIESNGQISVHYRDQMLILNLTSTELRKLAEEFAETAIRMDARGSR